VCYGLGRVFRCPEWVLSKGECCPTGSIEFNCSGKERNCKSCDGRGIVKAKGWRTK